MIRAVGPYGVAALGIYSVVSPFIDLQDDGTVTTQLYNFPQSTSYGSCVRPAFGPDTIQDVCTHWVSSTAYCAGLFAQENHLIGYDAFHLDSTNGGQCQYTVTLTNGQVNTGQTSLITLASTSNIQPTETELAGQIESTAAPTADIVQTTLDDSVAKNIDFGQTGLITPTTPVSVSAQPVEAPEEDVKTTTSPNPDGSSSTTTTTTKEKAVATPSPTGTTAADISNTWNISTVTTTTTTNNTTGISTTTITENNQGTEVPEGVDLCKAHPDSLACLQLDDAPAADPQPLQTQSIGSFTPPTSVGGSCPAPTVNTLASGVTVEYSYAPVCQYGTALRPFVIVSALIAAGFLLSGSVRAGL